MKWLLRTRSGIGGLLLRLGLAAVVFPHGAQKALGLWGGKPLADTVTEIKAAVGNPGWFNDPLAYCVIAAEFLGSIGVALGFLTRIAALAILSVMGGAIYLVHWHNGLLMSNGGFEYPLAIGAMALAVVFLGAGPLSVDNALSKDKPLS
jgi:putative oxidoreductase